MSLFIYCTLYHSSFSSTMGIHTNRVFRTFVIALFFAFLPHLYLYQKFKTLYSSKQKKLTYDEWIEALSAPESEILVRTDRFHSESGVSPENNTISQKLGSKGRLAVHQALASIVEEQSHDYALFSQFNQGNSKGISQFRHLIEDSYRCESFNQDEEHTVHVNPAKIVAHQIESKNVGVKTQVHEGHHIRAHLVAFTNVPTYSKILIMKKREFSVFFFKNFWKNNFFS